MKLRYLVIKLPKYSSNFPTTAIKLFKNVTEPANYVVLNGSPSLGEIKCYTKLPENLNKQKFKIVLFIRKVVYCS